MDEAMWLSGANPEPMVAYLRGKVSDRKLRLCAVACCQRIAHLMKDQHLTTVNAAERYAARTEQARRDRDRKARAVAAQADLVREIMGNPWRPVYLDPTWRTPDVLRLAEAAYEERSLPFGHLDNARLAILADALEEAGASGWLLEHLRAPGGHVRGCHVLDATLGRS